MATQSTLETKKRTPSTTPRFMLSFGTKYAPTHAAILKAAEADDRDPGEYLVRWLALNFNAGI